MEQLLKDAAYFGNFFRLVIFDKISPNSLTAESLASKWELEEGRFAVIRKERQHVNVSDLTFYNLLYIYIKKKLNLL